MIDSNADPSLVDYVIPANDDAVRSIKIIVEMVGEALESGVKNSKKVNDGKIKQLRERLELE